MSGRKVFFSFEKNKNTLIGLIMTEEMLTGLTMISVHCQTETVTRRFVQEKPRRLFCNSISFDESED